MDPLENPYTPHAGSAPKELVGRDELLEQFRVLVGRLSRGYTEQSMIIRGLRGVGKTVLLNAFESMAEDNGFLTYFHEITPETRLLTALVNDAQHALGQLRLSAKMKERVRAALGHLSTITLAGPEGIELSVDLKAAGEAALTEDLTRLFVELGRIAQDKGTGVAFFLDEVQFVREDEYRALISALHRSTQKSLPIALAAAGLPQIPRLSGDARSYAERLFTFPEIGRLNDTDTRSAFAGPANDQGVSYSEDAMTEAVHWTDGYPFYIQQLGKHSWNKASASPVDLDVVCAAVPAAQAALDGSIYEVRIQRATQHERRYMRAMAEIGSGPYRSGVVAAKLGKSTTDVSRLRQSLLDKGLVYATEDFGFVEFTVPRFDEFMRRYMAYKPPPRKRS
jgi:hypothetical protein